MTSTYSSSLRLDLQGTGDNDASWGSVANFAFQSLDVAIAGLVTIALTNGDNAKSIADGAVSADARYSTFWLAGTLTTPTTITIPNRNKNYNIINRAVSAGGGGQAITIKTATGTGYSVPSSTAVIVNCDGTSVRPITAGVDPSGNLILSTINIATGTITGLTATSVSAATGHFTSTLDIGATVSAQAFNATASINGAAGSFTTLNASATVSALRTITNTLNVVGTVSAANVAATNAVFTSISTTVVSANVIGVSAVDASRVSCSALVVGTSVTFPLRNSYTPFAWGRIDSSGNILSGVNVASVLHNGAGDFTVSLTTPATSSGYCLTIGVQSNGSMVTNPSVSTVNFRLVTRNFSTTPVDCDFSFILYGG